MCQYLCPTGKSFRYQTLKWELEDYCFRYLHPEQYRSIANLLKERRLDREQYIADFVSEVSDYLRHNIDKVEVYGRPKHIYSIWRKMQKKHLEFSDLYDVRAVRIIVPKLQDCYTALGIVHTHFKHIPKEFDDYVANPKPNGYQSIHTVVLGKGGKPVEVQIRTQQMHDDAELGVAAHWKYKEGATGGRSGYEEKSPGYANCLLGKMILRTRAKLWQKCVARSLTIAFMCLPPKVRLSIYRQVPPH